MTLKHTWRSSQHEILKGLPQIPNERETPARERSNRIKGACQEASRDSERDRLASQHGEAGPTMGSVCPFKRSRFARRQGRRGGIGWWGMVRDESVSGTLTGMERPGLAEAPSLIRNRKGVGFLVARLDR